MKHLRKFNTEEEKTAWQSSEQYASPNVVFVKETGKVDYNLLIPGVSIQHIDGRLYTQSQWAENGFTTEEANGVAVIDDMASFVISRTYAEDYVWSGETNVLIEGVMTTTSVDEAITDYAGKANTELIAKAGLGGAANACLDYVFPNGNKGYLPAAGEFGVTIKYLNEINSAIGLIGGKPVASKTWSSTQQRQGSAWYLYHSEGSGWTFLSNSKSYKFSVRPFTTL